MASMGTITIPLKIVLEAMPRCEACRWWDERQSQDFRFCEKSQQANGHMSGERGVYTTADFGCVQFEAKA